MTTNTETVVRRGALWTLLATAALLAAKFAAFPTIPLWVALLPLAPLATIIALALVIGLLTLIVAGVGLTWQAISEASYARRQRRGVV